MVTVHHFKVWNHTKADWEIPPSKRTAQSIAEARGEIILDTAEEIDPALIDGFGRYFPKGVAVQVDPPVLPDRKKTKPK